VTLNKESPMTPTRPAVKAELLEQLLKSVAKPEDLLAPDGLLHQLKGALMQRMLEAEMTEHLGYEPNDAKGRGSGNSRNGHSAKTVETESGPVEIRVPRDRNGTFEPQAVPKHKRRLDGFDDKVLALYARGMSTRDIQGHLRELYGTEVSPDLISRVTDAVVDEVKAWQNRPLEAVYPIVYLILTELKNRGVQDVFFACCDGLTGLPQAIEAAFPKAVVQTCIVHMIRASLRYVSLADRKAPQGGGGAAATDLRRRDRAGGSGGVGGVRAALERQVPDDRQAVASALERSRTLAGVSQASSAHPLHDQRNRVAELPIA
jgi:putative transposase